MVSQEVSPSVRRSAEKAASGSGRAAMVVGAMQETNARSITFTIYALYPVMGVTASLLMKSVPRMMTAAPKVAIFVLLLALDSAPRAVIAVAWM